MFRISREPLVLNELQTQLADERAGALVTFHGIVRNHNEGKSVTALEYEVYEELALKEGQRILQEAVEKFAVHRVECVHRAGNLTVGESAVWVGVLSSHRAEAFDACRFVIDEVKHRLPIWKKEYYSDGDSGWVNCRHQSPSSLQAADLAASAHQERAANLSCRSQSNSERE